MTTTSLSTIPTAPAATPPATDAPSGGEESATETTPAEAATAELAKEVAPQEPKEDPDLVIAQKLESVARREARARKLETQFQTKFAELETMKSDLAKKMADVESFFEDPVAWAMKNGRDPVDVVKRATKPMSEEERRLKAIEERLQKDEEERKKRETEAETRQRHEAEQRGWSKFVSEITEEEYPHLTSLYEASDVPKLVMGLLSRPHDAADPESPSVREVFRATYHRDPTPKEIRDALEHEAELRAMKILELKSPKPAPSQATPETPPAKQESTSLSNQHASSTTSTITRTKSREEIKRELVAELEAEASATE